MEKKKKSSFSNSLGFVLAAAGSAVGVGNIWRFPYLVAQDGGGLFLIVYLILVMTFGFTLLTTDVAIGRRTHEHALRAFGAMDKHWGFLGWITFLVPAMIMTYYTVIGGWVTKYFVTYLTGSGSQAAQDGYFNSFITAPVAPVVFMLIFLAATAFIVYRGVEKGIEKFSRIVMPGLFLLIIGIAVFSLTLRVSDGENVRTGLQGLAVYLIPNMEGVTPSRFLGILLDAMSQIFFSLSVSMGIMITYGSYVKKDVDLGKSLGRIEFFDTFVAFLAGMMIIPAVYVFSGTEGMSAGPGLMFVSLPKVFDAMGPVGTIVGLAFFLMVIFATLTSCVSIMETLVANCMEVFRWDRKKMCLVITVLAAVGAVVICMGYNVFYFEVTLPTGKAGQQLLDVVDYISNSFLMPAISLLTCIFVGWVMKPKWIIEEMEASGHTFTRKGLYTVMIRYVTPVMMLILFLQSAGVFNLVKSWFGK